MEQEIWKAISGFEGLYEVSNFGSIRSVDHSVCRSCHGTIKVRGRILRKFLKFGYETITLTKDGRNHYKRVHQLVAEAFVPVPRELLHLYGKKTENGYPALVLNHKDENRSNNRADNLEWCTQKYNINYGTAVGRRAKKFMKPILQFTQGGDFVARYESVTEAGRVANASIGNISRCAYGRYGYKTAGGFVWKWAESAEK